MPLVGRGWTTATRFWPRHHGRWSQIVAAITERRSAPAPRHRQVRARSVTAACFTMICKAGCVTAAAVQAFKRRLDKFWLHQDILYGLS